jgi:hypothetical protein
MGRGIQYKVIMMQYENMGRERLEKGRREEERMIKSKHMKAYHNNSDIT